MPIRASTSYLSSRTKLSVVFSVVIGIILLIGASYYPAKLEERSLEALREKMQSIGLITSHSIAPALVFDDTLAAMEVLRSVQQDSSIVFAILLNDSDRVFAAYNIAGVRHLPELSGKGTHRASRDENFLTTMVPVMHQGLIVGRLHLGASLADLHVQMRGARRDIILLGMFVFVVGVALVFTVTAFYTRPLKRMVEAVKDISAGDLTRRAPAPVHDEVGQLAAAFNDMLDKLAAAYAETQEINRSLERRVAQRTEELTQSEEALRFSGEQLRALSAHLEKIREEERMFIAREIHDELGQMLTAMNIDLAVVRRHLLKETPSPAVDAAVEKMGSLSRLIETAIHSVRRIALELRPDVLDSLGLVEAIEWQMGEFRARTNIICNLHVEVGTLHLDQQKSIALFRILQECLTNVIRHARATTVTVRLSKGGRGVLLEVRDDGKGIEQGQILALESLGIIGMRERALFVGGEFRILGSPGKGTQVIVEIPLDQA